jgi:hypothetical protein
LYRCIVLPALPSQTLENFPDDIPLATALATNVGRSTPPMDQGS